MSKTFSDEFNTKELDSRKWDKNLKPWGDRAWDADNVTMNGGSLHIRADYAPHTTRGKKYFYKLGIVRSRQKTTYGYYEAQKKWR